MMIRERSGHEWPSHMKNRPGPTSVRFLLWERHLWRDKRGNFTATLSFGEP